MTEKNEDLDVRMDKWLWAARFFKTRTLAREALEQGRVLASGERIKPSRAAVPGMLITVRRGDEKLEVRITAVSDRRGPASVASGLYEETESSRETRRLRREYLRTAKEPAASIRGGRPTKREGRRLRALREFDNS